MSGLMSIGLRGMFAAQAALDVTSHNIANANVAGYSRQEAEVETSKGQYTGRGFFGKGVNVTNVKRAHDDFLTMQAAAAQSLKSMDATRSEQLQQLQDVFPSGNQGIGYAMGDFLNSMVDLANTPNDASARQVVLARASDVADRFKAGAERIRVLQEGVQSDMRNSVSTLNTLAAKVADLNNQIAGYAGVTQQPNDLLDQRDQLISQISEIVEVSTLKATDGTMGVFIAGGQRLVLGNEASTVTVQADPADPSRSALALQSSGDTLSLREDMITGGSLAGLLKFQNDDLVDARNELGQMAAAFGTRVNEVQSLGIDMGNPAGAGAPLFSIGAPSAKPNANNAKDGSGIYIAQVQLTVTDATQLQASDYEMRADGSGNYSLKRLSDGLTRTVANGDTVDGFKIDVNPDLQTGDRFLLQPVGVAASGMDRIMDDVNGIAAASPVTATMNVANTGTATVSSLTVTDKSIDPSLTASVSFTSDTGDFNWELRDSSGNVTTSGTGAWVSGQPISLNGFEVQLNGVPKSGDSMSVAPTTYTATNNGNALAFAALRDERMVGRFQRTDGTIADGATATDAYAAAMADIGVRVQGAIAASNISTSAADQTAQTLASKTGVNLDEEASRLIQFQQAYQAAAKVLQIAQTVFDTMLQLGH
ncbi:MAG TPA: flagellar hook-associated protein FlgK [Ideonella sp.]|uniref:flagellar hook-associated protein FlgK n=1 Tax=Ideonella sp. TaxID=1929293 RepID=UPI002BCAB571|nr:flagellar hook-associated protein FlgK [Ideonella sp.]HSI50015.1 flagellar hook-associated protein FlgK [Ideonella sp.]